MRTPFLGYFNYAIFEEDGVFKSQHHQLHLVTQASSAHSQSGHSSATDFIGKIGVHKFGDYRPSPRARNQELIFISTL